MPKRASTVLEWCTILFVKCELLLSSGFSGAKRRNGSKTAPRRIDPKEFKIKGPDGYIAAAGRPRLIHPCVKNPLTFGSYRDAGAPPTFSCYDGGSSSSVVIITPPEHVVNGSSFLAA